MLFRILVGQIIKAIEVEVDASNSIPFNVTKILGGRYDMQQKKGILIFSKDYSWTIINLFLELISPLKYLRIYSCKYKNSFLFLPHSNHVQPDFLIR